MTSDIISAMLLPVIGCIACVYIGMQAMDGNIKYLRGKGAPPVKDPKAYGQDAGKLMLALGAIFLVTGIIYIYTLPGAIIFLLAATAIFAQFWKKNEEKHMSK